MNFRNVEIIGSIGDIMRVCLPSDQAHVRLERFLMGRILTSELYEVKDGPHGAFATVKGPTGISVLGREGWTDVPKARDQR